MPIDIFPEINIPVVSVVWTYNGMSAPDIQNRILSLHERQMASLVDDISRIEATSYEGVGVEKVYLHEGADVSRAVSQLASSALVVLKYMPPNITPPLVLRYGATDVPIIQLSLSSKTLPDTKLNDLGQNIIRPDLAVVHGAEVPQPYGGKPRVIMADLDQQALQARGLDALGRQRCAAAPERHPAGRRREDRQQGLHADDEQQPDVIEAASTPSRSSEVAGPTVFMRDVAHVHDGFQVQTNSVSVDGTPRRTHDDPQDRRRLDAGGDRRRARALPTYRKVMPSGVTIKPLFDQSIFVKAALNSVKMGGLMAAGLTALMILLFLGNWRLTLIILAAIPLSIITAVLVMYVGGQTLNTMTLGGFALAVGILVDNGTVVIENIERHVGLGEPCRGDRQRRRRGRRADLLSTLCICIVFVPVFLLQGTAKYLFSPLSLSVCVALLASLALSFTMVPVLFKYLMRSHAVARHTMDMAPRTTPARARAPPQSVHGASTGLRARLRALSRNLSRRAGLDAGRAGCDGAVLRRADRLFAAAVPASARFLSAGRCRPDAAARARPAGHALEQTQAISPRSRRKSARSSATTRSTPFSTTSACPIAA
jgi:multidrug efflux pump subunit AcrB